MACCAVAADAPATQPDLLGDIFRSPANGIALRPPVSCTRVVTGVPGEVAEFDDDDGHWTLRVTRLSFDKPLPLNVYRDQYNQEQPGLLQQTVQKLQQEGISQVVSQDVVQISATAGAQTAVGILVMRRDENFQRRLVQQAIVAANDQLYYIVELNTPARPDPNGAAEDPGERHAADSFNAVVDSIQLLDRASIKHDQDDRLIRFRGLIANWVPSFLKSRLVPEQYFRLVRDGKDIGYTYEIDEYDDGAGKIAGTPIIRVSVRSETKPTDTTAVEVQSRLIATVDRKHENWVNIAVVISPTPGATGTAGGPGLNPAPPKMQESEISEFGDSDQRTHVEAVTPPAGGLDAPPDAQDQAIQPGVKLVEGWTLNVARTSSGAAAKQDTPPYKHDVPAWYLPQAMSYLLPRLLPYKEPKTYLCAIYVANGDHGQPGVVLRYIDVLPAALVNLDGRGVVAVAIKDHLGLEGPLTTHYVDPETGAYLGSVNIVTAKDGTQTTDEILPTDPGTLRRLWPNCNLTRPDRIVDQPVQAQ
jgi:hypothetical protein